MDNGSNSLREECSAAAGLKALESGFQLRFIRLMVDPLKIYLKASILLQQKRLLHLLFRKLLCHGFPKPTQMLLEEREYI